MPGSTASGFAETGEAGAAAQDRLATGPTRALALTKQLVNASLDGDRATAFAAEAAAQEINMATRDAGEGVTSFVARRTPSYRGTEAVAPGRPAPERRAGAGPRNTDLPCGVIRWSAG